MRTIIVIPYLGNVFPWNKYVELFLGVVFLEEMFLFF
jgi:hypothetical protein